MILIEVSESVEMDMVYGPAVCSAVRVSALDFMSGAKVLTVRKVKAKKERPTRMLPYILWRDPKVCDFRKFMTMLNLL